MDAPAFDLRGIPYDREWLAKALNQPSSLGDSLIMQPLPASGQDAEDQDSHIDRLHSRMQVHLNTEGGHLADPSVGEADLNDR